MGPQRGPQRQPPGPLGELGGGSDGAGRTMDWRELESHERKLKWPQKELGGPKEMGGPPRQFR